MCVIYHYVYIVYTIHSYITTNLILPMTIISLSHRAREKCLSIEATYPTTYDYCMY